MSDEVMDAQYFEDILRPILDAIEECGLHWEIRHDDDDPHSHCLVVWRPDWLSGVPT